MLSVGLRRLWDLLAVTSNPRAHALAQENERLRIEIDYWHESAQHWRRLAEGKD